MSNNMSTKWVFTLNNVEDDDITHLAAFADMKDKNGDRIVKYIGFGDERAPTTGMRHLQGFLYLFKNARMKWLKDHTFSRIHLQVMKGTFSENKEYCSKEGKFQEFGEQPKERGQNVSDEYAAAMAAAREGRMEDIPAKLMTRHEGFYLRQRARYVIVPDLTDTCGVWLVGPSGAGKSRWVRETYGNTFYDKRCNKWFDGFVPELHSVLVIDDLDQSHGYMAYDLNRWADRYAFNAEVKGGEIRIRPKRVVVTSRFKIDEIWGDESTRASLKRRFEVIRVPMTPFSTLGEFITETITESITEIPNPNPNPNPNPR